MNLVLKLLLEELLDVDELGSIAHHHELVDVRALVLALVKANGAVDFAHHFLQRRLHGLEHRRSILTLGGATLQLFGIVVGQLEARLQRLGDVVAGHRHHAYVSLLAVNHHEVGVLRADINGDAAGTHALVEFKLDVVVDAQRGHLDARYLQAGRLAGVHNLLDSLLLGRVKIDLALIDGGGIVNGLVVPHCLVERNRHLRLGFVLDGFADLFVTDGRQADDAPQRILALDRYVNGLAALDTIGDAERRQGGRGGISHAGAAAQPVVVEADDADGIEGNCAAVLREPNRLDARCAELNAPSCLRHGYPCDAVQRSELALRLPTNGAALPGKTGSTPHDRRKPGGAHSMAKRALNVKRALPFHRQQGLLRFS
ncbi:MAG: hypothetical protein HPKKFMNG_02570 [Planctomycetes bacterium]|nr:hypothetical protein [Planctomycetota bacterium]